MSMTNRRIVWEATQPLIKRLEGGARAYNGLVVAWPVLERLGPGTGQFGSGKQLDLV